MLRKTTLGIAALMALGVGCQVIGGITPDLRIGGATEVCGDGKDNDGDELVDCEDPECGPSSCADGAPPGWEGPFWVTAAAWKDAKPVCPAGLEEEVHFAGPAGPPECEPCECGPLQGVTCSAPDMRCSVDTCAFIFGEISVQLPGAGECKALPKPPDGVMGYFCRVEGNATAQGEGSCFLTKDTELVDRLTWSSRVVACGPIGGAGCAAGEVCPPPPTSGARYCIRAKEGAACPTGWDVTSIDAFTGGTDTRSCGTCTCGKPTVTCEGSGSTVYDDGACNPMGNKIELGASCTDVSSLALDGTWSVTGKPAVPTGQCEAIGVMATGAMTPEGPIKYCCK